MKDIQANKWWQSSPGRGDDCMVSELERRSDGPGTGSDYQNSGTLEIASHLLLREMERPGGRESRGGTHPPGWGCSGYWVVSKGGS